MLKFPSMGWCPSLKSQNYWISSSGRGRREVFCISPKKKFNLCRIAACEARGGDRAQILAFGKLQLLLFGLRLHFPSENRKSCTSLHSGSIDSVQTSEAELQKFEAVARAEALALVRGSASCSANFEKFDQTFKLVF